MCPNKAAKAFEILDYDQDGRVSLHDIRDAILLIYKVLGPPDASTQLHGVLGLAMFVVAVILHKQGSC